MPIPVTAVAVVVADVLAVSLQALSSVVVEQAAYGSFLSPPSEIHHPLKKGWETDGNNV